jgi:hypothetical protein
MLAPERVIYDEEVTALRVELPETDLTKLWQRGRTLSTGEAVALALGENLPDRTT